jgi:hypothetical protein
VRYFCPSPLLLIEGKYTQVQEFMVLKIDTVIYMWNTLVSDDMKAVLDTSHIL